MSEEWKMVPNHPMIEASTLGNFRYRETKEMINQFVNCNYKRVSFINNGVRTVKISHRLIAQTFIPNPERKPQVNHIDENKLNNKVSNLNWMTAKENSNWGTRADKISKHFSGGNLSDEHRKKLSEAHTGVKLSEEHARRISEGHKGKKYSDASKSKISNALKTSEKAIQQRKSLQVKLSFIKVSTNELFEFESVKKAYENTPLSHRDIYGLRRGDKKIAKGYVLVTTSLKKD